MVETRAQAGKPVKKPGAYNTDLYYQEKDEGYGDVGVDQVGGAGGGVLSQERDAGALDNPSDPTYNVSQEEVQRATEAAQREPEDVDINPSTLKGETQDLTRGGGDTGEQALDTRGETVLEPVPIVEAGTEEGGPSIDEQEANIGA